MEMEVGIKNFLKERQHDMLTSVTFLWRFQDDIYITEYELWFLGCCSLIALWLLSIKMMKE